MGIKDFGISNEGLAPGETAFLGQHVYCVGDVDGNIKIIVDPADRDVPAELRAPGFHRPYKQALLDYEKIPAGERAVFASDGESVTQAGWLPGGRWAENGPDGKVVIFVKQNTTSLQVAINNVLNASLALAKVAAR